ncbi:MAG: sugar O-acetyltransferase [Leptotrichiaceae bacterium]|nr:sugar O-acetyltransferase [Leptotrichiaceae bacterium]
MTEKEKMISGKLYMSFGEELTKERLFAKELCFDYNNTRPSNIKEKNGIIKKLFGKVGKNFWIESPFICDYGYNIKAGDNLYINYNCVILDCAQVTFGNNVMIAPNVGIYTAGHPLDPKSRHEDLLEFAYPITIGNNVWIGANVTILPGVSIGDNSVIGAGSVVTKNIPENVVAVGNPCKVIRKIKF